MIVLSQLDSQLHSQLRSQLDSQLGSQLDSQLDSQYVSIWWQAWAAFYEGGKCLGVKYDNVKYDLFQAWCRCVPICRAAERVCIVSRWPELVVWKDSVLHNDNGPSVKLRDGFSVWTIEGVQVDEQIVMRPETQTVQQISAENNEEVKRIRIERYGRLKYINEIGGKSIESRVNDVDGTTEELFVLPDGSRFLSCQCRSTGRKYVVGVSRDVNTCQQAQSWMANGSSLPIKRNVIGAS
jgi:hypothetical protein